MNAWRCPFLGQLLLILLLSPSLLACDGGAEEEATAVAVIEQLVSTNTPTPEPTHTATPVPPTATPVPPTETVPPPPTATPFPPTPTPMPQPSYSIFVEDPVGDSYDCGSQQVIGDAEVDIRTVGADRVGNRLEFAVQLETPLTSDYSFAVLLALASPESVFTYIWETHETILRIGEMDFQSGQLVAEAGEGLQIEHDLEIGQVSFTISLTGTNLITDTVLIPEQFYIASFHTAQAGDPKNCDIAGPYDFSPEFRGE